MISTSCHAAHESPYLRSPVKGQDGTNEEDERKKTVVLFTSVSHSSWQQETKYATDTGLDDK